MLRFLHANGTFPCSDDITEIHLSDMNHQPLWLHTNAFYLNSGDVINEMRSGCSAWGNIGLG
jgi:hypothetical protein